MFVLGGSLCRPEVRAEGVPDADPVGWPDWPDRALVVGGCTDWLVRALQERSCDLTVVESPEHVEEAEGRWGDSRGVDIIEASSVLEDLPVRWFDLVFLLGGTVHTGGATGLWDTADPAGFRRGRRDWLLAVHDLMGDGGQLVADALDDPGPAVRGVGLARTRSGSELVEASVFPGPPEGGHRLVLRTQIFTDDGVQSDETVRTAPWVPLADDSSLLRSPACGHAQPPG